MEAIFFIDSPTLEIAMRPALRIFQSSKYKYTGQYTYKRVPKHCCYQLELCQMFWKFEPLFSRSLCFSFRCKSHTKVHPSSKTKIPDLIIWSPWDFSKHFTKQHWVDENTSSCKYGSTAPTMSGSIASIGLWHPSPHAEIAIKAACLYRQSAETIYHMGLNNEVWAWLEAEQVPIKVCILRSCWSCSCKFYFSLFVVC